MKLYEIIIVDYWSICSLHQYLCDQLRPFPRPLQIQRFLQLPKRQGIHCPNHLHPATWILESWNGWQLQHINLPPSTSEFWVVKATFDTDFWHIWNSEWSPCEWKLSFWYVRLHLCDTLIHRCDGFEAAKATDSEGLGQTVFSALPWRLTPNWMVRASNSSNEILVLMVFDSNKDDRC